MEIDKIELLANGIVQIRYITKAYDKSGGELVGRGLFHRETRDTDSDLSDLPEDAASAINSYWTAERKASRASDKALKFKTEVSK